MEVEDSCVVLIAVLSVIALLLTFYCQILHLLNFTSYHVQRLILLVLLFVPLNVTVVCANLLLPRKYEGLGDVLLAISQAVTMHNFVNLLWTRVSNRGQFNYQNFHDVLYGTFWVSQYCVLRPVSSIVAVAIGSSAATFRGEAIRKALELLSCAVASALVSSYLCVYGGNLSKFRVQSKYCASVLFIFILQAQSLMFLLLEHFDKIDLRVFTTEILEIKSYSELQNLIVTIELLMVAAFQLYAYNHWPYTLAAQFEAAAAADALAVERNNGHPANGRLVGVSTSSGHRSKSAGPGRSHRFRRLSSMMKRYMSLGSTNTEERSSGASEFGHVAMSQIRSVSDNQYQEESNLREPLLLDLEEIEDVEAQNNRAVDGHSDVNGFAPTEVTASSVTPLKSQKKRKRKKKIQSGESIDSRSLPQVGMDEDNDEVVVNVIDANDSASNGEQEFYERRSSYRLEMPVSFGNWIRRPGVRGWELKSPS